MTTPNTPATTHQGEAMPMPTITDDGLDLLTRQAEAMGAAHKLATVLCNTQMVPATFRGKPDDGAAAILYGAELGLKPQQALQQVFVVHGQPAIYARTMVALLKAKGYRFETIESTDEAVTVRATSPRGEVEEATWTIDRAKKAGYTSNKKYSTDPQAMLYSKAASEVSRKIAPDVLLGIRYSAEDLELEQPVRATATRTDVPAAGGGVLSAIEAARSRVQARRAATEEPIDTAHDQEPGVDVQAVIDGNAMLRELLDGLVASRSEEEMQAKVGAHVSKLGDDEAALAVLREAWNERAAEIAAEVQQ